MRRRRRDAEPTRCAPGSPRCRDDALVVLVHDAARPLVTDEVSSACSRRSREGWDGAVPGLPVADTLKRVGADGGVEETVSRDGLWAVQTPQAFAADALRARRLASNSCDKRRTAPASSRRRAAA